MRTYCSFMLIAVQVFLLSLNSWAIKPTSDPNYERLVSVNSGYEPLLTPLASRSSSDDNLFSLLMEDPMQRMKSMKNIENLWKRSWVSIRAKF